MKDKPKAVRCLCKFMPLVAPGRKIQCINKGCLFYGRKFATVEEWDKIQRLVVDAAIRICRDFGITREGV